MGAENCSLIDDQGSHSGDFYLEQDVVSLRESFEDMEISGQDLTGVKQVAFNKIG